jgi:hypothetical protein
MLPAICPAERKGSVNDQDLREGERDRVQPKYRICYAPLSSATLTYHLVHDERTAQRRVTKL